MTGAPRKAFLLLLLVFSTFAFSMSPAFAATYSVSVKTDAPSYSVGQKISISGTVSPTPGPDTAVIVTIRAPDNKTVVDVSDDPVSSSTGDYNQVTVAGGTANWVPGTYTVNATWGGYSSTATATTTFKYSPTATATTTTTTSSTTTTTTATTTTTSSASSSTTTSASKSTSTTDGTTSTKTSTSTSSATTTTTPVTTSSSSSSTSTSSAGSGLGSYAYLAIAAVAIIVVGLGIVLWRRKVASDYARRSAAR